MTPPVVTSNAVEAISDRIVRVQCDLVNLKDFWNVRSSRSRIAKLNEYIENELQALDTASFSEYDQEEKVDYILLKRYLLDQRSQLHITAEKENKVLAFLDGFFPVRLARLIEARQRNDDMDAKETAASLVTILSLILRSKARIEQREETAEPTIAWHATKTLLELKGHLREWHAFYADYDPLFTYWVSEAYQKLDQALQDLSDTIKRILIGVEPDDENIIIGEPIGRAGILDALETEMIPYTPEELIEIGKKEYKWCEREMEKSATELGFQHWREALDYVKQQYVDPGQQPRLVRDLAKEATDYVKKHDMVTVPAVCENTIRTYMMGPKAQKMNPFFLGGESIIVSYPTSAMSYDQKLMSMRGNNIHFSRATVMHELIPGHMLHMHFMDRHRPYRSMFMTPFCIEGWAFYWELVLWQASSWKKTPENRIGMLFWKMHRCARIVFSLKYHLGKMSAEECVRLLVDWVGHEQATAEGEVRRSIMGDYGPLYQAGYMLGGLQIYALRKKVVEKGLLSEKEFHDTFLRANQMPIELFRALLLGERAVKLEKDYKSQWKFYSRLE